MLCSGGSGEPLVQIGNITLHIDVSGVDLLRKMRDGAPAPAPPGASRRLLHNQTADMVEHNNDTVEVDDIELFVEVNNVDLGPRKDLLARAQGGSGQGAQAPGAGAAGRRLLAGGRGGGRALAGSDVVEIDGVRLHVRINGLPYGARPAPAPAPAPGPPGRRLREAAPAPEEAEERGREGGDAPASALRARSRLAPHPAARRPRRLRRRSTRRRVGAPASALRGRSRPAARPPAAPRPRPRAPSGPPMRPRPTCSCAWQPAQWAHMCIRRPGLWSATRPCLHFGGDQRAQLLLCKNRAWLAAPTCANSDPCLDARSPAAAARALWLRWA